MHRTFKTHNGKTYAIDDNPIHRGGEGAIYRIKNAGHPPLLAKIYHNEEKARVLCTKALYMLENPPFKSSKPEVQHAFVWPLDVLIHNNNYVGIVMPFVEQGISLFAINQPDFPQQQDGVQWQKFSRSNKDALIIRLKICYNVARAIAVLHKTGKYVLADLKPENLLVRPNGHFSLIDLDSIQICKRNRLLFPASAFTYEYIPPEFHQKKIRLSRDILPESFDHFAFAVILYQILITIHPFQASHNNYTTIAENIEHGLFVHGRRKKELHVVPPAHNRFHKLPKKLRRLFMLALDKGSANPKKRPSVSVWAAALSSEIRKSSGSKNKSLAYQRHIRSKQRYQCNQRNKKNYRYKWPFTRDEENKTEFAIFNQLSNKGIGLLNSAFQRFKNQTITRKIRQMAAVVVVIIGIYAGFNLISRGSMNDILSQNRENRQKTYSIIEGKYIGYVQHHSRAKQVAYLQIKKTETDQELFAMQLITAVFEDPVFDVLKIDRENNKINSSILGMGEVINTRNGRIILQSTENQNRSWHFEK